MVKAQFQNNISTFHFNFNRSLKPPISSFFINSQSLSSESLNHSLFRSRNLKQLFARVNINVGNSYVDPIFGQGINVEWKKSHLCRQNHIGGINLETQTGTLVRFGFDINAPYKILLTQMASFGFDIKSFHFNFPTLFV